MPDIDEHWTTDAPEPCVQHWFTKKNQYGNYEGPELSYCADPNEWNKWRADGWIRSILPIPEPQPPPLPSGKKE